MVFFVTCEPAPWRGLPHDHEASAIPSSFENGDAGESMVSRIMSTYGPDKIMNVLLHATYIIVYFITASYMMNLLSFTITSPLKTHTYIMSLYVVHVRRTAVLVT